MDKIKTTFNQNTQIHEVSPKEAFKQASNLELIDVRNPEEWAGPLGHFAQAQLITLGPDLTHYLSQADQTKNYVFVCRSGKRSTTAAKEALSFGLENVYNMIGGMILWNEEGLPLK